jgi:ribonuclease HI
MEVLMPNESETYYIFTDGACKGNPGPGGWAAIVRFEGLDTELKGYAADTTNNKMEVTAAIKGLEVLPSGAKAFYGCSNLHLIVRCICSITFQFGI